MADLEWTQAAIDDLVRLWNATDGGGVPRHSTRDIGVVLGISKNSVVGKAHRLGFDLCPKRASPIVSTVNPARRAYAPRVRPRLAELLPLSPAAPEIAPAAEPVPQSRVHEADRPGETWIDPAAFAVLGLDPPADAGADEAPEPDAEPAPPPKIDIHAAQSQTDLIRLGLCVRPAWDTRRPTHRYCAEPVEPGVVYCPACARACFWRHVPMGADAFERVEAA